MDNFSHAVASLAASECIHRSLPPEPDVQRHATRHRLLLVAGVLAGNFPDLDLVLTSLLPAPLGYLLHHRGHTHTLLYAVPQALVLWSLLWLCWPAARQLIRESKVARSGLVLAIATGLLLHLLMDYLNVYGVHPFHPFDSRWYYGDLVFIVEPVFWVAFGVPLAIMMPGRVLRFIGVATLLGGPLYFTTRDFFRGHRLQRSLSSP